MPSRKSKPPKDAAAFYGGLTYKQFSRVGRIPLNLNDLSWAGRLFPVAPHWWSKLTLWAGFLLVVCASSVAAILFSLLMRPDPALLFVFPDGQIVCAPDLATASGRAVAMDPAHADMCKALAEKSSRKWSLPQQSEKTQTIGVVAVPAEATP